MGGRGGYAGTIVGALILTVLGVAARVARVSGGGPPDPVRGDHRGRRRGLHPGDRRDLMEAERPRQATRHLGLDLGGTNIKWVVVEHDGGRLDGRRPGPGPDAVADAAGPRRRRRPARRGRRPRRSRRSARRRRGRDRRPGPVRPGRRHDAVPRQRPGAVGRSAGRGAGRRRRSGCPPSSINDARAFGLAELRLGAGRGASVDDRAHARDRRRRGDRHRRPRPPGPRRDGRRARPPDDRPRRAVVRLRQPRLPRGVRAGRPDRRRLRDRHGRGGGRPRPGPATRGRSTGCAQVGRYLGHRDRQHDHRASRRTGS